MLSSYCNFPKNVIQNKKRRRRKGGRRGERRRCHLIQNKKRRRRKGGRGWGERRRCHHPWNLSRVEGLESSMGVTQEVRHADASAAESKGNGLDFSPHLSQSSCRCLFEWPVLPYLLFVTLWLGLAFLTVTKRIYHSGN